jgi:hypothetical protein
MPALYLLATKLFTYLNQRVPQVLPGATCDVVLTIHGPRAGFIGSERNGVVSKSVSEVRGVRCEV